ncbi:MAG: protein kinase [Planctomycetes bacterium]|nr:protein kinase [Planctomycetota bacterium]
MSERDGEGHETTTVSPGIDEVLRRRQIHKAAFEATLKEVFLQQQIQLVEPLAKASKETVVYGGLYHGEEVAVKIFIPAVGDIDDAIGAFGAFKVECEKTMILSRRSKAILQVIEYGDADLPKDLAQELSEFFPVKLLPFMITERARFGSLDRVLKHRRNLPGFDRVSLLEALAGATDGIKEAHDHFVAHRDIKPQNILIFAPGQGKIADFGIARWRSRRSNKETVLLTPKYSSPEQAFWALTGEKESLVDTRGDVYSWAIMVYEVVTGHHPFTWAIKGIKDPLLSQRTLLKAIAANDRRGFLTTGDITFDSLIYNCTCDLKHRVADISLSNRVLRQYIQRLRMQSQESDSLPATSVRS